MTLCSFNNDFIERDEAAIDLSKDISIGYQGWYYDYMEEDKQISREPSVPLEQPPCHLEAAFVHLIQPLVPLPIDRLNNKRKDKGQTLSQILAISKFHVFISRNTIRNPCFR